MPIISIIIFLIFYGIVASFKKTTYSSNKLTIKKTSLIFSKYYARDDYYWAKNRFNELIKNQYSVENACAQAELELQLRIEERTKKRNEELAEQRRIDEQKRIAREKLENEEKLAREQAERDRLSRIQMALSNLNKADIKLANIKSQRSAFVQQSILDELECTRQKALNDLSNNIRGKRFNYRNEEMSLVRRNNKWGIRRYSPKK